MFIKRVYIKLIDSYFNFASFYKPTGDGLLLTIPYNETNLKEMAQKTVISCIACHTEFSNICNNDPMINFEVPDKIGIGIARGTVCCLVSGENTIDYSGRLLNLASRLTNLARPSGIIIDGSFDINLLDKNIRNNFREQDVYLDGIAEYDPVKVYFTKKFTTIPKRNTRQIAARKWRRVESTDPFRDLLIRGRHEYRLESAPTSAEDIRVTVRHYKVVGGKVKKDIVSIIDFTDFTYEVVAGKPTVWIDFPKLCEMLKKKLVKRNMDVWIDIAYAER